jgi:DNA end-binding protein Ku
VPKADIDKRYLDKPYYITPTGKVGADAFAVIRDVVSCEALRRTEGMAVII